MQGRIVRSSAAQHKKGRPAQKLRLTASSLLAKDWGQKARTALWGL